MSNKDSQSSNHRGEIMLVAGLVLFANALDVISTYLASSDMTLEGNPLVEALGCGWGLVIAVKAIVAGIAIGAYYFHIRYRRVCYPQAGCSRGEFIKYFMLGRRVDWLRFAISPAKPRHALCWVGGILGVASSLYYTMLSLNNLAIWHMNATFDLPAGVFNLSGYWISRAVGLTLALSSAFLWMARRSYREFEAIADCRFRIADWGLQIANLKSQIANRRESSFPSDRARSAMSKGIKVGGRFAFV